MVQQDEHRGASSDSMSSMNPDAADRFGRTGLWHAACANDVGALDALVDAVGAADDPAPSFDAVRDPKRRADARRAYAGAIIEAFTTAYAALLDPSNGYGDAPKRAMRHGPNALSTLLGGV